MTLYYDHHIAAFVSGFYVAVRLGDLLQRIDPVNSGLEFARLGEFFQQEQMLALIATIGIGVDVR